MIRIISLTDMGERLAHRLQASIPESVVWHKPKPFTEKVQQAFLNSERLLFICATGIVIRSLASVIKNKKEDPAVLVMDERGKYVIPLLSGHQGGANKWAKEVASCLGAQTIITTEQQYTQAVYTVGMGCEKYCTVEELYTLLSSCLDMAGIRDHDIHSINSIDIKMHEPGLLALSGKLHKPFLTWSKLQLNLVEPLLHNRSDYVYQTLGVYAVAESAALFALRRSCFSDVQLLLPKQVSQHATCAIARGFDCEIN